MRPLGPVIQLRLAISPRFVHADAKETALIMRDAALLAWLALEGPTSRTRLAAQLWPDSTPYAGRNALRQRLFQSRKQLGVELVSGSTQLTPSAAVVHDLADSATVLGHERCELGPDLDALLARVRAASVERARQRLLVEAAAAEQVRDCTRALQCAQAVLALDPLREDSHRGLTRAGPRQRGGCRYHPPHGIGTDAVRVSRQLHASRGRPSLARADAAEQGRDWSALALFAQQLLVHLVRALRALEPARAEPTLRRAVDWMPP